LTSEASDRRVAVRLGWLLAVFLLVFHRGHFMSSDELGSYFQTRSIARSFSLEIPGSVHMAFSGRDGRSYSHYAIGQSLLAAPLDALGHVVDPLLSPSVRRTLAGSAGLKTWHGEPAVRWGAFPVLFLPPAIAGALAGLFFLFERRLGATRRSAVVASVVLVTATHVGLMGTLFLRHTAEAFGVLGALFYWHRFRTSRAQRDLWLGSAWAAAILNLRGVGAINGVALGGYLCFVLLESVRGEGGWQAAAKRAPAVFVPLAISLALYGLVNWLKWGSGLASPQLGEAATTWGVPPWPALWGFLLSPGMSVFVYSPVLLLLPWTFAPFWRRHRAEALAGVVLAVTSLGFYSAYRLWTGLYTCPGPRYLVPVVVVALLPLGPWLDLSRGRALRVAFGALVALGVGVELLTTVVSWGDVISAEGYESRLPAFGFVFEWHSAPVVAAARHAFDPGAIDLWLADVARGWRGQPARPGLALGLLSLWALGVAGLARSLARALAAAPAPD